jgi:HKD family nuclease
MLKPGIYEQVINKQLCKEIDAATDKLSSTTGIDPAEASKVLAQYISEVVEKGLNNIKDSKSGLDDQVKLANRIVSTIMSETGEPAFDTLTVDERAEQLLALIDKENTIFALDEKAQIIRPKTSIAQSSLFTGAIHEPSMYSELKKEIVSSDRTDMLVSFIKWSGLRLIIDELKAFTMRGGRLRMITTSYMGATDAKAIEELKKLPNTEIMVSYDTKRTRLHAKTYVFYRETGFTTAYVGSSNLSNVAISSGLEWNVKITAKDLPEIIQKIGATFESYWNSKDFELYSEEQKTRLAKALKAERSHGERTQTTYMFDITPYPYQQEILDKLRTEREVRGYYKNLVVAATGTGKTVVSGFDFRSFCKSNPGKPNRLLFVAHREEILKQSLVCFQGIMKDANFGDLFVGGNKPESLDHLFVSVQTFNSQELDKKTSPDFYDYIIIDEFHHAAAPTYQRLLTNYKPTTGLDPLMRSEFIAILKEEKKRGKTIFMTSHMFEEVEQTCDKVAFIKEGKIIAVKPTDEIKHHEDKVYQIQFTSHGDYLRFLSEEFGFANKDESKNQVTLNVHDSQINALFKALKRYDVKSITEIKYTLEKYFKSLY